ncbi:MAG: flavodoxin family protein [Elusimicrobia bacterium]|nr:flavodoxin family protein [Elusimicrobiota bacterium]
MKIIGFNASPRKDGNTAWTINKILEGAQAKGAGTEIFHLNELNIKPCQGCLGCKKGNKGCVINDDMQKLYGEIERAAALILGTPVYMGQMSAQAKTFVDRWFARISPRFSPHFNEKNIVNKKMILVFTQGNPNAEMFREYFDYTKKMFELLEFDVKDVHVIAGMRNTPAHERKDLAAAMKEAGSSLV